VTVKYDHVICGLVCWGQDQSMWEGCAAMVDVPALRILFEHYLRHSRGPCRLRCGPCAVTCTSLTMMATWQMHAT
jgi:hypothetical protein